MTADDVLTALNDLGFDKYVPDLKDFLKNYNADKEDQPSKLMKKKGTVQEGSTVQDSKKRPVL